MNEKQPEDVTDEQILEVAEPFGAFEYGDAQGDKRIDFARAILALRPVQVPMTEWQPIETAPRDGPFLAVIDCGGAQVICTMRYVVAENMNSRPSGEFIRDRVTHWMPLPTLPASPYVGTTNEK